MLASNDRQVEPEHVAVQEHDEDEKVDRKRVHGGSCCWSKTDAAKVHNSVTSKRRSSRILFGDYPEIGEDSATHQGPTHPSVMTAQQREQCGVTGVISETA